MFVLHENMQQAAIKLMFPSGLVVTIPFNKNGWQLTNIILNALRCWLSV